MFLNRHEAEKQVHLAMNVESAQRRRGEWFYIDLVEAKKVLDRLRHLD